MAERPEYFLLPVKSILNRCDSKRVPFEWTINPYRGCEFACKLLRAVHARVHGAGRVRVREKIYVRRMPRPCWRMIFAQVFLYLGEGRGRKSRITSPLGRPTTHINRRSGNTG